MEDMWLVCRLPPSSELTDEGQRERRLKGCGDAIGRRCTYRILVVCVGIECVLVRAGQQNTTG